MPKRKLTLRLAPNEVALVGSTEQMEHLVKTYEGLAEQYPEHHREWQECATWVRNWINYTKKRDPVEEW
ncbi:MAG TPA: hypothetical protein VJ742_12080 [Nitrososphaera sp.]|nr:hypothetical protein [Nitrososphaera sp.]